MIDIIICISTNLFRIYLIRRFMQIFFGCREEEKGKEILVYGGFFLINTGTFLMFHLVWINIICNLAGIGLIVLLYTKSIKMNLFVTCSIYLINIGCDAVSTLPFIEYQDGESFTQVYAVISVLLIFICELFTEKIINERKHTENIQNFSLALVPICSIFMLCLLIYIKASTVYGLVIISVGLIMSNFLIFNLYNMLSSTGTDYELESENRIREKITNDEMIRGYELILGGFCVLFAIIGIAHVFSNTLGFLHQRKREFARYMSVGITPGGMGKMFCIEALVIAGRPVCTALVFTIAAVAVMIKVSYLEPAEFVKAAPVAPILFFIFAVFGFIALAYYLGARRLLGSSLAEALKDDRMV